jgi:hypothetical protein
MAISPSEIVAKAHIYAETDPKVAVRRALNNLGWTRGTALMEHMQGPIGFDAFTDVFVALIEQAVKRAGRHAQDQRSLTDQLIELRGLAIKAGLYDADDAIAKLLEKK